MSSYQSPLESLAAFALAFVTGALSALGLTRFIRKVKKEVREEERARHDTSRPAPPPSQENPS